MSVNFVHLHLHTEFSLSDGLCRIKPLTADCRAKGLVAVAMTDLNNLFAMVKFYRAAMGSGVKPLIGLEVDVSALDSGGSSNVRDSSGAKTHRLVLLCRDHAGYLNLSRLISRAYLEGQQSGAPVVDRQWMTPQSCAGLIALSAASEGDVGQALLMGDYQAASRRLGAWQGIFADDFYIELQRIGRDSEETLIAGSVKLAAEFGVPLVATNNVRFLQASDFEAHEARVCIQQGRVLADPRRPRNYTDQQYLRTEAEMIELFSDLPEALENSVHIARRCTVELELGKNYLPDFPIPDGLTMDEYFAQFSREGLEKRLAFLFDAESPDFAEIRKPYDERLQIELDVIISMGFPGYFLIVADFIRWAKDNAIPVGPGRGSGAGSLVAYAQGITDLDPLEYDLLFERFLNPERVSMPDFDVDFCMENRDKVIDYVARTYGRDKVSQIATHGTMAAKAVVRDVGRIMGHPYGFVDRIAKLIPFEIGITLEKALEQEEELSKAYEEEEVAELIDMAKQLEGLARNVGRHAGGVVIAPTELTDFSPVYMEAGGEGSLVTQFDKDDVEAAGLVKFDFLGLRTLTIIDWALQAVNGHLRTGDNVPLIEIERIPLDDVKAFKVLKACQTTAVFQLESRGMKDLIKRLIPDCFEDIVALVALFRPGPLQSGMVDDFIARKHGAKVEYPHPDLEPILQPTYGIILYQEQVMQIAQVLAGYTLGGADMLRRAMGKKKPEEMAKQRTIFTDGAVERGVEASVATYIFDLMEKFAGYGFNKSHSAAYALVSYQTAWLKSHYPAAFMAAVLSSDMDTTDKVVVFIEECRSMKLAVVPPDVNRSNLRFKAADDQTVVYGLGAIKGVGESAIDSILAEREQDGLYKDLFDLCARVDLRRVNRRVMEALVKSGALDKLGPNRATLTEWLPVALQSAEQQAKAQESGQTDLFGLGAVEEERDNSNSENHDLQTHAEWEDDQRLAGEKETLGLYLTGHPVLRFLPELNKFTTGRLNDLGGEPPESNNNHGGKNNGGGRSYSRDRPVVVAAGLLIATRIRPQRNGRVAFLTLDDQGGRIEVKVYERIYEEFHNLIAKDKVLIAKGKLAYDEYAGSWQITAETLYDMDHARAHFVKRLQLGLATDGGSDAGSHAAVQELMQVLEPFRPGSCPIWLDYQRADASAQMRLGEKWAVHPTDELLRRLEGCGSVSRVDLLY